MPQAAHLLRRLAHALDRAALPYMIIGGQAVLVYGEPRLTRDVDVTLGVDTGRLADLLHLLPALDLELLVEDPTAFVQQTWVLPVRDPETGFRVDFIFSWTPYERAAIERARALCVCDYPVRFATPEDLIIHKILANRPRDLEDVRSILRKQNVDLAYIRDWLQRLSATLETDLLPSFEHLLSETNNPDRSPH